MKSKTARSLRRPLCNRGFGHETRHQQRHTQPQCSFSLTGLYIYPLPPPPPLLSTSLLYYHPLSWTPLSLHIHTTCPPPPYTTTHSDGQPTFLLSYYYFSESPPGSLATPQPQLERPARVAPGAPSVIRNGRPRAQLQSRARNPDWYNVKAFAPLQRLSQATRS